MERIGIFGGSFNPIHRGHIEMANIAVKKLNLDKLYLVPVGTPTHRCNKNFVCGKVRLKMVELSCLDNKKLIPCDIEVVNKDKSYTYDTLLKIKEKHPSATLYEIIGEDSAEYLHKWKNYNEMFKIAKFVYFKRDGYRSNNQIMSIEAPLFNLSSTIIREKIKKKEPLENFLIKDVEEYIKINKLYEEGAKL
ncbi:MAG: nicotinate-nucleotide adenylyltransferase [Psychrilyobacter sp.]|nr:nicotinate-nucleotide adenylyltransferase [Psychrilyobacter sp.]